MKAAPPPAAPGSGTLQPAVALSAAAIVHLAGAEGLAAEGESGLVRARAFVEPLLAGQLLDTQEPTLAHADGTAAILRSMGAGPALCAAIYLVYAGDHVQQPEEVVRKAFGDDYAGLVTLTRRLVQLQRSARLTQVLRDGPAGAADANAGETPAEQTEHVRKMLLAFSRDLRVVLLRLASRLQTLRWYAASRLPCPPAIARESMQVLAPLANRLGIWQIKWELEDLAFRFLQAQDYQRMAALVDQKRVERERMVQLAQQQLGQLLLASGIEAEVVGRPKHLYSIWKKMQGKQLAFDQVLDASALRVIVADVPACYDALACVHAAWTPLQGEFDDYIGRPKPNGYQSLHTVVMDGAGRPLEVQIRTRAMHEHAEHGVAAHWMYKEAGVRGYAGVSASGEFEERLAEARKAVLRELLAWQRDTHAVPVATHAGDAPQAAFDDRIYVFTPQARIIDLPTGATPVDFAYALHTELGHRCRGARVDGHLVPLNTRLLSGQTVDVVSAKEGGPSLDWINPELGFLMSPRARAKVRAWFNTQAQGQTIARGREQVERLLQREGRTALDRQTLAEQLGFKTAEALFEVVGKDEFSLRSIENLLRPPAEPAAHEAITLRAPRGETSGSRGGVLVVGMDSLLTTLARCCRPAPPDAISGYVTRGQGVAVHRRACANLRQMAQRAPDRLIEVAWGQQREAQGAVYPAEVLIQASARPGLLRDLSEAFLKERVNVTAVSTQKARAGHQGRKEAGSTVLSFTVEVPDTTRLAQALLQINQVAGVRHARRR